MFIFISCSGNQNIISSSKKVIEGFYHRLKGLKIVKENKNSTYAYITLTESEKPYVHDHNDVRAYILRDGATLHFSDKDVPLKAGQFIMIPKQNIMYPFPKVFLIITPKIGKDFKRYIK